MTDADRHYYGIAAAEVAEKRFDTAIMAKAYADSKGDERRAIAEYISLRVADLASAPERELAAKASRRRELWTACKKCGHRGKMRRSFFPGEDHAYFSGIAVECTKCGQTFDWYDAEQEA